MIGVIAIMTFQQHAVGEAQSPPNDTREHYDLVILGSGSTAFAAALRAAELGKTAVMTESRTLGGTCVNRGCLPSKNLIEAARIIWEAQHPRYPGLRPTKMEFDFKELIRQRTRSSTTIAIANTTPSSKMRTGSRSIMDTRPSLKITRWRWTAACSPE